MILGVAGAFSGLADLLNTAAEFAEMFPCWIVADFKNRNLGLAYSEYGHGNRGDCWGVET